MGEGCACLLCVRDDIWPTNYRIIFVIFLFSLKLECEKLANEKVEIQRHYVMVRSHSHVTVIIACCSPFKTVPSFISNHIKCMNAHTSTYHTHTHMYSVKNIQITCREKRKRTKNFLLSLVVQISLKMANDKRRASLFVVVQEINVFGAEHGMEKMRLLHAFLSRRRRRRFLTSIMMMTAAVVTKVSNKMGLDHFFFYGLIILVSPFLLLQPLEQIPPPPSIGIGVAPKIR